MSQQEQQETRVYVAHTPDGDDGMSRVGGVYLSVEGAMTAVESICGRTGDGCDWQERDYSCEDGLQWVYTTGPTFDDPIGYISRHTMQ